MAKTAKKKTTAKRASKKEKKTVHKKGGVTQSMAIAALIINLLIPGLGSIIAGKTKVGIWQLVLALVGFVLSIVFIGIFIGLAAWIWALVTSIKLVSESSK